MEQMLEQARNTLQMEADAILELVPRVDEHFSAAVAMILDCPGRVVITGMGKSGIIGRKMAVPVQAGRRLPERKLDFDGLWRYHRSRIR